MDSDRVMSVLQESEALLNGHFELRSGLHSNRYFQCANVLRFPRRAGELCAALAEKLKSLPGGAPPVDTVIAPAMGGIVVGHEVARVLDVRSIFAEKQDGKLVLRRFVIAAGERCLVAEDVITRGGRVQETVDIVRARGGVVVAVVCLVDRSNGQARFGVPLLSLMELAPVTYEPADCPLCRQGLPLVHPGS